MATFKWAGDVAAVAQVDTVQITGMDATPADTTYILTVGGKTVQVVGDTDEDTTAVALGAAWNASTEPEFAEVTATVATDTVTLTADTPGRPFTAVSSVSGGTGTIGAVTSSTANDGPNVWSADNFIDQSDGTRGTLPDAADTVLIEASSVNILYNLDQSAAGDFTLLDIKADFTGQIGLPPVNADAAAYTEYRPRFLKNKPTTVNIGDGSGNGSSKIRFANDDGDVTTLNVFSTGSAAANESAIEWDINGHGVITTNVFSGSLEFVSVQGTGINTTMNISGDSAVAIRPSLNVTTINITDSASLVYLDPDESVGTFNIRENANVIFTGTISSGTNIFSGTLNAPISVAKTFAAVVVGPGGILDTSLANATLTLTNTTLNGSNAGAGELRDPGKRIKFTNPVNIGSGKIGDFAIDVGAGRTVTFSDP